LEPEFSDFKFCFQIQLVPLQHGVPHVAVYRAHPITELAAFAMAKTPYAALPNIVLGGAVTS
jgi:lipid A disaccharide synthetase